MKITLNTPNSDGAKYSADYSVFTSEALPIEYVMTPASGNADVPSAAVLTVCASKGGTPDYSAAAVVTNNTTSYTVSVTVPQDTLEHWNGLYYFAVTETHSGGAVAPVTGTITVYPSVEVQS